MIICTACGRPNADQDEFCEDCGRYLAWSGEHVDDEPEPEPEVEVEPQPEPVHIGFFRRVGIRLHLAKPPEPPEHHALSQDQAPSQNGEAPDTEAIVLTPSGGASPDPEPGGESELSGEAGGPFEPDTIVIGAGGSTEPRSPALSGAGHAPTEMRAETGSLALDDEEELSTEGALALSNGSRESQVIALRRPNEAEPTRQTRSRRRTQGVALAGGPDVPRPGDIFCPVCNQFNAPDRVYCRRCGSELHVAVVDDSAAAYVTLPFWRRHFHRDVRVTSAGSRPGKWGKAASGGGSSGAAMRIMSRVGMVVVGAAVVISFVGPAAQPLKNWYSNVYHSVLNKVDVTYTQEFAIGANATSQTAGHAGSLAVDDADNTYWMSAPFPPHDVAAIVRVDGKPKIKAVPATDIDGVGQKLTVVFSAPTTINRIGVLDGITTTQQAFLSQCRPEEITVTYGKTKVKEHLQDTSSFQHLALNTPPVISITFTIDSVYKSVTGHRVAITEIEFFQRQ